MHSSESCRRCQQSLLISQIEYVAAKPVETVTVTALPLLVFWKSFLGPVLLLN